MLGVKEDILQVEEWDEGEFYVAATIRNRLDNWRWSLVTIYGPADHALSDSFLAELGVKCETTIIPLILGRDFNLIREESDKSNGVVDRKLMKNFNDFIEREELREIYKLGGKFTWSNNQESPIQSNLDRVLVSTD